MKPKARVAASHRTQDKGTDKSLIVKKAEQ